MEDELQHASATPTDFTFHLLERITKKISNDNIIGHGGYGIVYKGVLDNGEVIAVKKLHHKHPELDDGKQFKNECINLMMAQHQNVVRLVGYCHEISHKVWPYDGKYVLAEVEERALCFEYLQGGSLDKHLSDESSGLGWGTRYKIIKGICEGLHYLHNGNKDPIYHLDLKPANILLDKNMKPKIGDFGLSRLVDSTQTTTTKQIRGTPGYMPPEYINKYQITAKFDIFSLGVIIIQLMSGHKGYSRCGDMSSQEFIDLVHNNWLKTQQETTSSHTAHEVNTCIEIALRCVEADRVKRPTIIEIVDELNKVDIGKRSLIEQVTNSQRRENFNQYSSSGAAADSAMAAVTNPRIKYGNEGTSMGRKEKEHGTPEHKVLQEDPDEWYKTQDPGQRSGGTINKLLSTFTGLWPTSKAAYEQNGGQVLNGVMNIRIYTRKQLKEITNNYTCVIGKGSFCKVYGGALKDKQQVAIKKSIKVDKERKKEFIDEIIIQSQMRHKNIVSLLGCCLELDVPMLVYEFAARGSLSDVLFRCRDSIPVDTRLGIAIGSAEGLTYMHSAVEGTIRYGDVKSANILLDENFTPKVSNFGISKLLARGNSKNIIGDISYMDPVYMEQGILTQKSDVYSFGIVLIDLITRRRRTYDAKRSCYVANFVQACVDKRSREFIDNDITSEMDIELLEMVSGVAVDCLRANPEERPDMKQVEHRLLQITRG